MSKIPARRRAVAHFWAHALALLGIGYGLLACEPQELRSIEGVTVIAVELNPPTANPGDTVQLDLTYFDSASLDPDADEDEPEPQVAWFGGCHNPAGETATGCLPLLGDAAAAAAALANGDEPANLDAELLAQLGFGTHFEVTLPDESVGERQRRPDLIPFGVSFPFFAVCKGELTSLPEARQRLAVGCVDDSGEPVPDEDFVIGFSTIFVFDEIQSESPRVGGIEMNGEPIEKGECVADSDCQQLGRRLEYTCHQDRCLPTVAACAGDCEQIEVAPLVRATASELDPASVKIGDEPKHEMVWVKYYAIGPLDRLESLIIDRDGVVRSGFAAKWKPPRRGGMAVPIFTVVQDSRGGTTPLRADVWVK